ncbi:MAG: OB-fold nucleic acid binding domain-containing protein, partial [Pseudomonadota bacterium]
MDGTELTELPGIGQKTAARFKALGILRALDLIYFLPRAYQDRTNPQAVSIVAEGQFATVSGQIMSIREQRYRTRRTLEVIVNDGSGTIILKWFRFGKWLKKNIERKFPPGTEILASGKVSQFSGKLEMHHPDISEADVGKGGGIVPIYPLTEGISQQAARKAVKAALAKLLPDVKDEIPEAILERNGLPHLVESLSRLHEPLDTDDIEALN